jgi:hypothetical protein
MIDTGYGREATPGASATREGHEACSAPGQRRSGAAGLDQRTQQSYSQGIAYWCHRDRSC